MSAGHVTMEAGEKCNGTLIYNWYGQTWH